MPLHLRRWASFWNSAKGSSRLRSPLARLRSPTTSEFQIDAAGQLTYSVPRDLRGLLRSVHAPKNQVEWLRNTSPGLSLQTRDGRSIAVGSDVLPVKELKIARQGSHVCELSFQARGNGDDFHDVWCHGSLTIPLAKSWVEIRCRLDDPRDRVSELAVELDFAISPQPLLVDFSCGELAYLTLRGQDMAQLDAQTRNGETGLRWQVLHGTPEKLTPFAVAAQPSPAAGGWMHVMDQKLCTAAAAADFGRFTRDRFTVATTGRSAFRRTFPAVGSEVAPPEAKQIHLWYHFVYFPPQISAVTSPQSMLQPLVVKQPSTDKP